MAALLPDCMMPDGGDPCAPFSILQEKVESQAAEIARLRALFEDACKVFEHYDLPEHALHYRRVALGMTARQALKG